MSWFKQTTSSASIGFGILLILASIHTLNDKTLSPEDRSSDSLACLLIGAPLIGLGVLTRRTLRLQKQQAEQDRLRSVLYGLLQRSDTITVLQFAIAAQVPGEVAKQFLAEQAQIFAADCEVSDRGEIVYRFQSGNLLSSRPLPPHDLSADYSTAGSLAEMFDVILVACPANRKIAVLKVVRELTGMDLKRTKDLVESVPQPVKQNIRRDLAEAYVRRLELAGATVMLDRHQKDDLLHLK